jgi:hypothetical protein
MSYSAEKDDQEKVMNEQDVRLQCVKEILHRRPEASTNDVLDMANALVAFIANRSDQRSPQPDSQHTGQ